VATITVLLKDRDALMLIVIILLEMAFHSFVVQALFRHQKALEWFSNHIRLENSRLPQDAPSDMGRKEDDEEQD
jgi:hypothetical protein